jgi:tetratricopeptide (TPR) repeat protein
MMLGLETNLTIWQFLLLFLIFIAALFLGYYLVSLLLRQEPWKPGRNWGLVGLMVVLLPPILGLGAILGTSMFGFFVNQLHTVRESVQTRVFIRDLEPRERMLRMVLSAANADSGLHEFRDFLIHLEQQDRYRTSRELIQAYDYWNRNYLSLLYIAGRYEEITDWENARMKRFPNLVAFPAFMSLAAEAMGRDGSFWMNYLEATNIHDPAVGFVNGYLLRNYGRPDSALKELVVNADVILPIDFMSIALLGERVRALTDEGRYDEAREIYMQLMNPLLSQSEFPLLRSYLRTTRVYLEIHYYVDQNSRSLSTMGSLEESLMHAISENSGTAEPWILSGIYYFLNQDNARAIYYFNDVKARYPWIVNAASRFLGKVNETKAAYVTQAHYYILQNIDLGLKGQLVMTP